jgi:hypothetical protein
MKKLIIRKKKKRTRYYKPPIKELKIIEIINLQKLTTLGLLNDWENNFCNTLLSKNLRLSINQSGILKELVAKYKIKNNRL